jgi:hypothetical protein
VWLVGQIAAGWLVSGVAVLAHLDWVLLPLLVLAVSAVLRTGRNAVDRLMMGTIVVAAALVAGALVFSRWPWRLAPFPVMGCLFTAVAVVASLGGRRPRLPRGFALSDLMIVGTGLFVLLAGLRPLWQKSSLDRFVFGASSEDRAAHFALFDTVHRLGSYPFFEQAAARVSVQTPTEAVYPAGSHLLYAVIDILMRSTSDPGPTITEFNRYVVLVLGGYAFFVMATVWAARWILTPLVAGWRLLVATSAVAAVLIGGRLMSLVTAGFDSQVLGTAFVGLIAAVAIKPPPSVGDRVTLFGALAVLVAYTYYLYLPLVALAIAASFLVHRRFLRAHLRFLLVSAVVVAAIAAVPLYFVVTSTLDVGAQALATGATMRIQRSVLVAVTVAGLAVLVRPGALRQRRNRITALLMGASLAVIVLFGAYQRSQLGKTSYYYEKLWVCYLVVGLICSAPLVTFLAPRVGPRSRLREAGAGVVAAALAFTAVAGFGLGGKVSNPDTGAWGQSSLGMWYTGRQVRTDAVGDQLKDLGDRGLLADGTPTLFLVSDVGYENWRVTFTDAALNRVNGALKDSIAPLLNVSAGAKPVAGDALDRVLTEVGKAVSASRRPLRIVVRDPGLASAITRYLAAKPELPATVVVLLLR